MSLPFSFSNITWASKEVQCKTVLPYVNINTFFFKVYFVHPSGRWEMKCTCKQTEIIHGTMIAFHQLHQLYTAMGLGEIHAQLVKNTPWNNSDLVKSWCAQPSMIWAGSWQNLVFTKSKLTLAKRNGMPGWRLFLICLSILLRWKTGKPALRWIQTFIRLSIKYSISHTH